MSSTRRVRSPAAIDRRGWRAGRPRSSQPGAHSPGPGPRIPGLEDAADAVSLEEQGKTRDVILVRMGQDEDVDPPVPRRDALVELDEQPVGIRAAVDQHPAAAGTLDEDRIALADVEHA